MAEKEGFEPPRRRRPPGFQDRSLQPDLGISPNVFDKLDYSIQLNNCQQILCKLF